MIFCSAKKMYKIITLVVDDFKLGQRDLGQFFFYTSKKKRFYTNFKKKIKTILCSIIFILFNIITNK